MRKVVLWCAAVIIVILGVIFFLFPTRAPLTPSTSVTPSSTVESGTPPIATGTTPPSPPLHVEEGVIKGNVVLGPTCPVERIPPDPDCAPKPYQTTIHIQPANPSSPYTIISTDTSGAFSVSLDPGTYSFQAQSENNSYYPRCTNVQVQVASGSSQTITISCDTGIR